MTLYLPEPTTAAEVLDRARKVCARRADAWRQPQEPAKPIDPRAARVLAEIRWARAQRLKWMNPSAAKPVCRRRFSRDIIEEVAKETGVSYETIVGPGRRKQILDARFEAIKRVAKETGLSLHGIGLVFGGRDHSTILNALTKMGVSRRRGQDERLD